MVLESEIGSPAKATGTEPKLPKDSIFHALTRLFIRGALACLNLCTGSRPSQTENDPQRAKVINEIRMAYASLDHQLECQCTFCRNEVLITDLRLHLLPICDDNLTDFGTFLATCEPFTATEIELLDSNDEEYIRSAYPGLAARIQEQIDERRANYPQSQGISTRLRGMYCQMATRH